MNIVKRLLTSFLATGLFLAPLLSTMNAVTSALPGPNLIANPSVETVNPSNANLPQGWKKDFWGTNTRTFTYVNNEGHTGTRSVKTQLKTWSSGDAKWYFNQVTVQPNKTYTFSDYYKSNVATEVVVEMQNTAGGLEYVSLGNPVASPTAWNAFTANFTAPANAQKVTVFHLVKSVGWIQMDDAYFGLADSGPAPTPPSVNVTAPAAGSTVNGTVALKADASDAVGVAGVQFKVDNTNVGAEDVTAPYEANWDTTAATNTSHSVTAVARNTSGLTTTSNAVQVTVNNATAPTVSVTAPAAGATVNGTIALNATAASPGAAVAGVQFKVDGTNVGSEDTTAPYEFNWDTTTASNAPHDITAVARSTNGLSTTSNPVQVTVNNVVTPPPVDTDNIIPNPSVETADSSNPGEPASWSSNSWGTNTSSFSYENTGRTGTRSVKTQITAYTDGDAKWYFDPVDIVAGKSYVYRDYYKSDVPTRVVVAFINASGNFNYQELAGAPAASDWTQYNVSFTAPSTAVKVTVFHLIDRVGSLTIDDALLQVAPPPAPESIPANGSLEQGTTTPTGWQTNKWGSNTANFQYVSNDGHTGTKSVKVTVSNYVDGDAKWFFNPVSTLTPGKQYRFTTWYKTNITPQAVAMFIDANGNEQYVGMPAPLPGSNSTTEWQRYSDTFTVPANAVQVSAFLFVNKNGWLQTDDYSVTDYTPNGFNQALLSLTFDDSEEDNVTTALPVMTQYGFKSTQCYATTFVEGNQANINNVLTFKNAGHEICSHTVTHPMLTSLNDTDLNFELQHSKQFLEGLVGQPVVNFASPFGDYNQHVLDVIKGYYQSHRTVDEGFNSKDNFDVYRLRVQNILDTTTAAQVNAWVQEAQADKTWLILVYHRVANDPGPFDTTPQLFADQMAAINASGITVKTMQDALTEVKAQL